MTLAMRKPAQWAALIVLSALFVVVLHLLHLPAALLLGPMAAGIVVATHGLTLRTPRWTFLIAQAVIGGMIARTMTPAIIVVMMAHCGLFLAAILAVVAASAVLGWLLARWGVLPGTVAVWGSSPGAATVMTLMAGAYGADSRLVAFMQYLRVVLVAVTASVVARLWVSVPAGEVTHMIWFPAIAWPPLMATLALATLGGYAGQILRIPAGPMVLPLALGAVLQGSGVLPIELPPWLLAVSYAVVGWNIGLTFTPAIVTHVARAFPRVAASILVQIAICGGLAFLLTRLAGIDPLTAYLATSPGGADSIAIIAAGSSVDLPFVMAFQTIRLMVVIFLSPRLARFMAGRMASVA